MNPSLGVAPIGPIDARIRPPGSKSITNRAILCAALAQGSSTLVNILDSQDTRLMADALQLLGTSIEIDWTQNRAQINGCGGPFPVSAAELNVENSGTAMRFLTAAVSLTRGRFRLIGSTRMHQRPVGDLLAALRQLGVNARAESAGDCPPVVVESTGWNAADVQISAATSSQFASGLMLAAPYAEHPITIHIRGPVVSAPFLQLTADVMSAFGGQVELTDEAISISNRHRYRGCVYQVEPDATAASYFLAAAAIAGGTVTIEGLGRNSKQGDLEFANRLAEMGCRVEWSDDSVTLYGPVQHGIEVDMGAISDTVQTLAVVALFADGPTRIRNVAHIRHKESDRIGDLARELRNLGAVVDERPDGLRILPSKLRGAAIDTYDDHRMAMSLSLIGLKIPGIEIRNPSCVAKTYPNYFQDLARVTGTEIVGIE